MKVVQVVLLASSLALGASIPNHSLMQDATASHDSPDVTVQSFAWGVARRRVHTEDPTFNPSSGGARPSAISTSTNSTGPPSDAPPVVPRGTASAARNPTGNDRPGIVESVETQYEAYVQVKNSGSKFIKAIEWEFVFFSDPAMEHESARHKFRSKKRIAPGEIKFLSELVTERAASAHQRVLISRVEFADGSVWLRQ